MRIPQIKFVAKDGREGIVQHTIMHPDSGAMFEAEIRFTRPDGTTYVEGWRGPNMLGSFTVTDAFH